MNHLGVPSVKEKSATANNYCRKSVNMSFTILADNKINVMK
jgi:hypothetical protein